MEYIAPTLASLFALIGTIVSAFVLHNKNKSTLDLKVEHLEDAFETSVNNLERHINTKLDAVKDKMKDLSDDIKCIDEKVDANVIETGKIGIKVVKLEKDVEALKGNSVNSSARH